MGRHNREARGEDQHGRSYEVSYQPDWLHQVKVTRDLENGRQSTRTLFRNQAAPGSRPAARIRTHVSSGDPRLDFTIELEDPAGIVTRIIVETHDPSAPPAEANVSFSIEARKARQGRKQAGGPQKT